MNFILILFSLIKTSKDENYCVVAKFRNGVAFIPEKDPILGYFQYFQDSKNLSKEGAFSFFNLTDHDEQTLYLLNDFIIDASNVKSNIEQMVKCIDLVSTFILKSDQDLSDLIINIYLHIAKYISDHPESVEEISAFKDNFKLKDIDNLLYSVVSKSTAICIKINGHYYIHGPTESHEYELKLSDKSIYFSSEGVVAFSNFQENMFILISILLDALDINTVIVNDVIPDSDFIKGISNLKNMKKLIITPDNGVLLLPETISYLNNFEYLEIKCNEDLMSIIPGIGSLEHLKMFKLIRDTELKFEDLESLKWLPMKISLDLSHKDMPEMIINDVFSLNNLSELVLNGNFILENVILDFESTNLKSLDIKNVLTMTNSFNLLENMPNIENLEINNIQNFKIEQIKNLPHLKSFSLTTFSRIDFKKKLVSKFITNESPTDEDDLQKLGELEEFIFYNDENKQSKHFILERLIMEDIQMDRKIADTLVSFKNLRHLELSNISDLKPFFRILSDLKSLISLEMTALKYKNEDINKMFKGLSIEELRMIDCNQLTESKEKIYLPRTVKFLEIRNQNLTSEFISGIAELSNLEELELPGCALDQNMILSSPFFNRFEIIIKRDKKGINTFDSFKRKVSDN